MKKDCKCFLNHCGFTLIEIIASISILSILVILMVPIVTKASNRVKYQSYINLENMIIQATINYLNNSAEPNYSIDTIKASGDNCSDINSCYKTFTVGEILDKNIYYSSSKDKDNKITVFNPTNGKSMRNRTFIIYYDIDSFSLKGRFSKGIDDEKYESEVK